MTIPIVLGEQSRFSKTVSESDIYLFAGVSGDLSRNHVDEAYMRRDGRGGRIAHGALLVAYMSAASTRLYEPHVDDDAALVPVSLGYDRIRFLKPVPIGDTITVTYTVSSIDPERGRAEAAIEIHNQHDELVAIATHVAAFPARSKLFAGTAKSPQ
jgi:acyl dehydratase